GDEAFGQLGVVFVRQRVSGGDARLGREGLGEPLGPRVERNHAALEILRAVQPVLDAPLAVDELHDADDLAARVDHRDGQDGARLVARLFVEGAIVTETPGVVARSRRGELVPVRDVDDLAGDDAAADDRAGIDRQRELREVELGAVILRDFETKRALRYVFVLPLDDVDRSRVGICNISAFFQYQREQLVDVALRRQGAADRVDLVDLRLVSV